MIEATLLGHLRDAALTGYGYPDHLLIWRHRLPTQHHAAVHAWSRREGHSFVELVEPDSGATRAYWLVPREALAL